MRQACGTHASGMRDPHRAAETCVVKKKWRSKKKPKALLVPTRTCLISDMSRRLLEFIFVAAPSWALCVRGQSNESCFSQTWNECSCDDIVCNNDPHCINTCDARLVSDPCRKASSRCKQYDARVCGTWCSDQRFLVDNFTCSKCRR